MCFAVLFRGCTTEVLITTVYRIHGTVHAWTAAMTELASPMNASALAITLPEEFRLTIAVAAIIPILFFGLLCAAICAQPGRRSCAAACCAPGECMPRVFAVLLVACLSTALVFITLLIIRSEIADHPSQELMVQFCEVKWGGLFRSLKPMPRGVYLPEWGSMCSAVFIVYAGMHQLFFWVHDSAMLRLIAAMFCVNGVASFFYHMTALRSWGLTDGNSMLFLVWVVVAYMWDEVRARLE